MKTAAYRTFEVLGDVADERLRQTKKFGDQSSHDKGKWYEILGEEFGEVAKASLEGDDQGWRDEMIQVAAVAVAAVEGWDVLHGK